MINTFMQFQNKFSFLLQYSQVQVFCVAYMQCELDYTKVIQYHGTLVEKSNCRMGGMFSLWDSQQILCSVIESLSEKDRVQKKVRNQFSISCTHRSSCIILVFNIVRCIYYYAFIWLHCYYFSCVLFHFLLLLLLLLLFYSTIGERISVLRTIV